MKNLENSPGTSKLELAQEPSAESLQEKIDSIADEITALERSIREMQKEYNTNPSPQLESEIGISQFRVTEQQDILRDLIKKQDSASKTDTKRNDPWSDQYIGGRNGAARNS